MVAMGVAPWGVVRNRDALTNPKVGPRVLEKEGVGILSLWEEVAGGLDPWIQGRRGWGPDPWV